MNMCRYNPVQVAAAIDLAVLKPEATSVDVSVCCQKAIRYECASVCVKPYHVPIAARLLKGYNIAVGTVVGFPHGSDSEIIKANACHELIQLGADELDAVINIAAIKDGDWGTFDNEVRMMTDLCHTFDARIKIILETCYLKPNEIYTACQLAADAGADWVKTSTGFGIHGATPEAVQIMVEAVEDACQVKASGDIRTYEDAETYLDLGCTRLGSSRVAELMPCDLEGE